MAGPIGKKLEFISRTIDNINKVIGDDRFEASLNRFLPQPSKDGVPVRKRLREAQFRQLAEFCSRAGRPQWGLRPRTYAVLRMIGCPETIENFINERLTDIFLPYSEDNLPSFVTGEARTHFLDCQNFVLNGRAAALETPGEPHQNVEGSADDYFVYVEDLGAGGFGEVDSVIGEMSLMKFARKRIKRHRLFSKDKASLQVFENELQTLKSLSHRHLVQLVGSYTDSSCVGLIMTPVADMNLATYLKIIMNPESRKICLRRFFGCLAAALSYLHDCRVQHKDIKPANILVKQQYVYLTDFGTSRSWDNDASKSTLGTVAAFTPRYCAPEVVQFGSSRNESRDIWSLGCVFLEMCSVLADHTADDMCQFLKENGTHGEYIRENSAGVNAWKERLQSEFSTLHDRQPLELAVRMCTMEPQRRPVAKEVLSTILDFDGPIRYYGLCCDEQSDPKQSLSNPTIQPDRSCQAYGLSIEPWRIKGPQEAQEAFSSLQSKANYRAPTVEDPTEDMTVQAFFPPGGIARKHVLEDSEKTGTLVDLIQSHVGPPRSTLEPSQSKSSGPAPTNLLQEKTPLISTSQKPVSKTSTRDFSPRIPVLDFIKTFDVSHIPCPWPRCSQLSKFDSYKSLADHLRQHHGTHELFWTPLLGSKLDSNFRASPSQWVPGQIISEIAVLEPSSEAKAFVLRKNDALPPVPVDPFADSLKYQAMKKRMGHDRGKHDPCRSGTEGRSPTLPSRRSRNGRGRSNGVCDDSVPFCLLPEDRRPEPLISGVEDPERRAQEEPVIRPDPILEPSISNHTRSDSPAGTISIPRSSLVPSYFLATTNRFSREQIKQIQTNRKPVPMPPPLFVYGSFMFPSVLRAQAEKSISAEGIYSRKLQRRIQTSAEDWSNLNKSLRHAAQQMTPAFLKGYLRFKVEKSGDAALMPGPNKSAADATETRGFLVSGLSYEAYVCLDYLLSPEGYYRLHARKHATGTALIGSNGSKYSDWASSNSFSQSDSDSDSGKDSAHSFVGRGEVVFQSSSVRVTISDPNGNPHEVEALTYVWQLGPRQQVNAWSPNDFVKCQTFSHFSTSIRSDKKDGYDWVAEEGNLASEMGILYAMPGDDLCDRIVKNDVESIVSLITHGADVDASCHHYGTPLQAAAAKGHEKLVYVMLQFWKADPNKQGGRYNSPLVAAISNGHENVVSTLLRHGANPITRAGSFISPIYQAVSFEDVEMTHMLLERGAWLSKDYIELLDLAEETGNVELCSLLHEYDISDLHKRKRIGENRDRRPRESQSGILSNRSEETGLRDLVPALVGIWRLKGQRGKWTGTKGIKALRLLYGNNVPLGILDVLRQNLQNIHKNLLSLCKGNNITDRNSRTKDFASVEDSTLNSIDDAKATVDPKDCSQGTPRPSPPAALRIAPQEQCGPKAAVDEVFCLTCNGRGGRKGTGRPCEYCRGTGTGSAGRSAVNNSRNKGQADRRCRACNGTGNIFSERDRCRACKDTSGRGEEQDVRRLQKESEKPEDRRSAVNDPRRDRRQEYQDPPPPYPGRR